MRKISIAIPVLNEASYIVKCLSSVKSFTVPKGWVIEETLILDGVSSDNTRDLVLSAAKSNPGIKLISNPGRIQSAALNIAIKQSVGEYLLRLDAHAIYSADYLSNCIAVMESTKADNVGGIVITLPGGDSYWAQVVQALTTHKFGVGNSGFRTGGFSGRADTVPFGFFKKEIFSKIGLFDERLLRAQDYELNRRLSVSGGAIWLDSRIQASYFNQPNLIAFLRKQISKEAPYNAYMWYLAPYSFAYRHAITAVFVLGIFLGLALWPVAIVRNAYLAVLALYFTMAFFSGLQQACRFREWRHCVVLPVAFFLYHFVHGLGVLYGLFALLIGLAPVQKRKEPWVNAGQLRSWPPPDGQSWGMILNG